MTTTSNQTIDDKIQEDEERLYFLGMPVFPKVIPIEQIPQNMNGYEFAIGLARTINIGIGGGFVVGTTFGYLMYLCTGYHDAIKIGAGAGTVIGFLSLTS